MLDERIIRTITNNQDPLIAKIPRNTVESLRRYAINHVPCGHFLTNLLSNNLFDTFGRADPCNREAIPDIVTWLYNRFPGACYGSPEKVEAWLAHR